MRHAAVVTGGATGIGLAVVERLADDGWPVAVIDADVDALAAAEDALGGEDVVFLEADPTDEDEMADAFDQVVDRLGLIGGLVCVSGFLREATVVDTSAEMLREALDRNLVGPFVAAKAAVERMGATLSIVTIGSVAGLRASRGQLALGVSQAGLKLMGEALAQEFGGRNVRVNSVAAGPVAPQTWSSYPGEDRNLWLRHVPQGRHGEPEEIAAAVAFLMSEEASFVNGHTLAVDGGFLSTGVPEGR